MPYTVSVALEDFAGAFASTPSMRGSIFSPPPPSGSAATPIAIVANAKGSLLLPFTSTAVPPPGPSALLVVETAIFFGDLFRSGVLNAYPTPPTGALTLITPPPPGSHTLGPSDLAALVGGFAGTTFVFPNDVRIGVGLATGGWLIPLSAAIAAVTLAPAPGTLTLVVTGTLRVRQGGFFVISHAFTLTMTLTAAPSHDSTDASRVVSIGVTATTLTATGVPGFVTTALAPAMGRVIAPQLESLVNAQINQTAQGALAGTNKRLTPTAQISALRITITAAGVSVLPVLGDLFGPGIVTITPLGNLSINILPTPVARMQHNYLVTVTNVADGTPVAGATMELVNYDSHGIESTSTEASDAQGHATFAAALHIKVQKIIHPHDPPDFIYTSPTLNVSATAFNSQEIDLLDTP